MYAVPSMFLDELPRESVEQADLSSSTAAVRSVHDAWRNGSAAAEEGWAAAGVRHHPAPIPPVSGNAAYVAGMLVRHATYGQGRVVEVSGHGAMRKVKIRFTTAGERSFIADKVKLEVVKRP
jgi:DNA helicase-2/ATP-dependent DNA helicase PcrA